MVIVVDLIVGSDIVVISFVVSCLLAVLLTLTVEVGLSPGTGVGLLVINFPLEQIFRE